MTKSISRSQVRLITSTNAIFGADEACAMLHISRDAMYRLAQKGLAPMAAAGPRGRDGPSPREFTAVRHFMMADLGLSGLPLLVYARIFGFCDGGCDYFESKGNLARFLNVQERSAHRAIRDLLDRGLIEECGVHVPARGHATKRYRIVRERLPPGALAAPDDMPPNKQKGQQGLQKIRKGAPDGPSGTHHPGAGPGGRALLRRAGAEGVPALRRRPRSARRGAGGQGAAKEEAALRGMSFSAFVRTCMIEELAKKGA